LSDGRGGDGGGTIYVNDNHISYNHRRGARRKYVKELRECITEFEYVMAALMTMETMSDLSNGN
jgi:hypothetical protein